MALSSTTVWEVRTTGSDTNGGGFRAGASGTDYSQQDAPQLSISDAAASGTTTLTSATGGFTAAMVGNIIQISGGTLTAGFYEITACSNTNTATLDRSPGNGSGSTVAVGGALATPAKAVAAMVPANTAWIRSGNYTLSNQTLSPPAGVAPNPALIRGYNSTRGDLDAVANFANFPMIQKGAGSEPIFTFTGAHIRVQTLILNGNSLATYAITTSGATGPSVFNVKATNCMTAGFNGLQLAERCHATANVIGFNLLAQTIDCVATANTGSGFTLSGNHISVGCLSYANTGASSHGFLMSGSTGATLIDCVAYGNGGDGLRVSSTSGIPLAFPKNCIFAVNGGYGINYSSSGTSATFLGDYNAFYGNTSGARNNIPAGAHDVTLTGNPFTNAAGGDFSLIAGGGGGQCRAAGYPGTLPGGLTIGAADIGAAQHADPAGAGQARIFGSGVVVGKGVQS